MPKIRVVSDGFLALTEITREADGDWLWNNENATDIELTAEEHAWISNAEKRFWNAQEFLGGKVRDARTYSDSDS